MLKHFLRTLFFEVTERCNCFCEHCGSNCIKISEIEDLPINDIVNVLSSVNEKYIEKPMIMITGGEPLLRVDFWEIAENISKMGFSWGMTTNGTLIDSFTVNNLKKTKLATISISLDGLKNTHEKIRRFPGSFENVINGIKLLKSAAFLDKLQITTIISKSNVHELDAIYELVRELGIDSWRVSNIDPIGRGKNDALLLSNNELLYLYEFIKNKRGYSNFEVLYPCCHFVGKYENIIRNHPFVCQSGTTIASVLNNGGIFGCLSVERRRELIQGNVRLDDFCDVWENCFSIYRDLIRTSNEKCLKCEYWKNCRGDSFHTWDFDTKSPLLCYKEISKEEPVTKNALYNSTNQLLQVDYSKMSELIRKCFNCAELVKFCFKDSPTKNRIVFLPNAISSLMDFFYWGKSNPINHYELQVALIGQEFNCYAVEDKVALVQYVLPTPLSIRERNWLEYTNIDHSYLPKELEIILRNLNFDNEYINIDIEPTILGFAHTHPHQDNIHLCDSDYVSHLSMYGKSNLIGITLIVNPQNKQLLAFSGSKCDYTDIHIYINQNEKNRLLNQ